jgi:hypothetical protein
MKKLFIIMSTLLLVYCINIESNTKTETPTNSTSTVVDKNIESNIKIEMPTISISTVLDKDDYSDSQNDLVYYDYGTGIKLSNNSSLIITQLDLNLNGETATIYVINLENSEVFKVCVYQPMQAVSYTPASEGVYKIIAEISNGEIIDLTPKVMVQTSSIEKNVGGFILLK